MEEIWTTISEYINTDNIALLSVVTTILIFIITRCAEIKYKKLEDKKIQYLKLVELFKKTFTEHKKGAKIDFSYSNETKSLFFDAGSSLLLYGSKKIYKQYLLFREFSTNPLITASKYYKNDLSVYIIGNIFKTIRKEVGLSFFDNIETNDALAFFINDISSNPLAIEKSINANFRIAMIRFELFIYNCTRFIHIKKIYFKYIKPIFSGINIMIKYFLRVPFGKIFSKLFPNLVEKK